MVVQPQVDLEIGSVKVTLTHRQAVAFAKALIDWRNQNAKSPLGTRKNAFAQAHKADQISAVKENPPRQPCKHFSQERFNTVVHKTVAALWPEELDFLKVSIRFFSEGIPEASIREQARQAQGAPTPKDTGLESGLAQNLRALVKILGLDAPGFAGSQKIFRELEGEYLIFRRIFTLNRLMVSYLVIEAGPTSSDPATFVTQSGRGQDEKKVAGLLWYPPTNAPNPVIFGVGKMDQSAEVRSTLLTIVDKPGDAHSHTPNDLKGLRLGRGYVDRQPRAYRIWCSRLTGEVPQGGWISLAREYHWDKPANMFHERIVGFEFIRKWLAVENFAVLTSAADPLD